MNTIFVLLFLIAACCLTIGLIKPDLASKVLNRSVTRKSVALVLGSLSIVLFILVGATAPAKQQEIKQEVGLSVQTHQAQTPETKEKIETKTEAIPFQSITENDPTLPQGQTKIKQAGKNGAKEIRVKVTFLDGKEIKREPLPEVVSLQPVSQITVLGTYVAAPPMIAPAPDPVPESNCNPNYSGCVPNDSDVDCAGGSGNGPSYIAGPVTVIGSDVYDLDRDGDGVGCE